MKLESKKEKVAVGLGVAALLYFLFKPTAKAQQTVNTVQGEASQLLAQGMKKTYSDAQYRIWADNIRNAMFDLGTNEDTLYTVFRYLKNDLDFLALYASFGVRTYYTFGIPNGDWNLTQWFEEELDSSEIAKLNAILAAAGIKYRV